MKFAIHSINRGILTNDNNKNTHQIYDDSRISNAMHILMRHFLDRVAQLTDRPSIECNTLSVLIGFWCLAHGQIIQAKINQFFELIAQYSMTRH